MHAGDDVAVVDDVGSRMKTTIAAPMTAVSLQSCCCIAVSILRSGSVATCFAGGDGDCCKCSRSPILLPHFRG